MECIKYCLFYLIEIKSIENIYSYVFIFLSNQKYKIKGWAKFLFYLWNLLTFFVAAYSPPLSLSKIAKLWMFLFKINFHKYFEHKFLFNYFQCMIDKYLYLNKPAKQFYGSWSRYLLIKCKYNTYMLISCTSILKLQRRQITFSKAHNSEDVQSIIVCLPL